MSKPVSGAGCRRDYVRCWGIVAASKRFAERKHGMTDKEEQISFSENYNRAHAARLQSPTTERLYQAAYGDEYPAEISPSGFYTRTILRRLVDALNVGPGDTLADLGCGHGSTGLWVAQQLGADLVGIDLSSGGVA